MSPSDDSTRPISVAELLARNGTIGAPPAGGRRRRRRGNNHAVTVAELTGEIPVFREQEIPVADEEATEEPAEELAQETAAQEQTTEIVIAESPETEPTAEAITHLVADIAEEHEEEEQTFEAPPPLASAPLPHREQGPELSHDPRPARRPSGAEQMTYDPVDQSVDLADLVDEQADDAEELRAYLRSSGGTLFSGETVADDLARRGISEVNEPAGASSAGPGEGRLTALRHGMVAILQSVLAVIFGAGLFLAFDQLWRWNNVVALVLSVLVILGLVVSVRVVRKTEDIASTLIAVAVGALVTLGPLALLQST